MPTSIGRERGIRGRREGRREKGGEGGREESGEGGREGGRKGGREGEGNDNSCEILRCMV